ncbi:MAG TPA: response regulator [Pirellulales bacterium]|nr:response regulator [Pirellulales bacterium]
MSDEAAILVVEDQRAERDALSRMLETEAYRVVAARNPREAMAYVHQPIDLVICDLRLGTASGVDVLRDWRRSQSRTPFIMVTAYGDVPTAVAAMKLGAEDYMTKPVDPSALLGLVNRLLRTDRREGQPASSAPGAHDDSEHESVESHEGRALEVLERRAILDTLEQFGGNRTRAADALGISVRTLQRKLKAWGMAHEV